MQRYRVWCNDPQGIITPHSSLSSRHSLASTFRLTIEKPRTARAQIYRDNVGSVDQSPSTYYRLNVFYTFIDHVVTELETRFLNDHEAIQHLIPVLLGELNDDNLKNILGFYGKFLSVDEKEDLFTDTAKWKKYEYVALQDKHKSVSLSAVLKPFQCCVRFSSSTLLSWMAASSSCPGCPIALSNGRHSTGRRK